MPDISKCRNLNCPSKEQCYRFTSEPNLYQTYSDFKPEEGKDKCDYFWQNYETDDKLNYNK